MRTIVVGNAEVDEFIALVGRDSKWAKRLLEATSFYVRDEPVQTSPVDHFAHWNTPPRPGWVLTNRDRSYYHTSGIYRWVPAGDPAADPVRIGEVGHEGIPRDFSRSTSAPFYAFTSPGIPAYAKPLPDPLHIGKRVRYQWHENGKEVYYTGTITSHYIDSDDCSGTYGEHKYGIKSDMCSPHKGESCSCAVKRCQLFDYVVQPALVTGERYQVDPWGKTYYLINNGDTPSGIKYL